MVPMDRHHTDQAQYVSCQKDCRGSDVTRTTISKKQVPLKGVHMFPSAWETERIQFFIFKLRGQRLKGPKKCPGFRPTLLLKIPFLRLVPLS